MTATIQLDFGAILSTVLQLVMIVSGFVVQFYLLRGRVASIEAKLTPLENIPLFGQRIAAIEKANNDEAAATMRQAETIQALKESNALTQQSLGIMKSMMDGMQIKLDHLATELHRISRREPDSNETLLRLRQLLEDVGRKPASQV